MVRNMEASENASVRRSSIPETSTIVTTWQRETCVSLILKIEI